MRRLVVCASLVLSLGMSALAADLVDPVAKVNNEPVSREALQSTLLTWYGKMVLEELIQAVAIQQAAKRANVVVTDEQVAETLATMRESMNERYTATGQGQSFSMWLAERRLTVPNLQARLRTQLRLEGLVEDQVKVAPKDISAFYEKNRNMFREPTRVKVSVISLKTKEQADQVRKVILSGEKTWAEAARLHNINPYTMKTGGDLGYRTDDGTELMKAAMALENDGDISDVVAYGGLFNIIKREDKQPERTLPFEDVKQKVTDMMTERKRMYLMEEMRTALMKSAHIERLIEFPQESAGATEG